MATPGARLLDIKSSGMSFVGTPTASVSSKAQVSAWFAIHSPGADRAPSVDTSGKWWARTPGWGISLSLTAAPSVQVVSAQGRFSGDCPVKGEPGSDRNLDICLPAGVEPRTETRSSNRGPTASFSPTIAREACRGSGPSGQSVWRPSALSLVSCRDHFPLSLQITFVPADSDFLSPKSLSLMENRLLEVKR